MHCLNQGFEFGISLLTYSLYAQVDRLVTGTCRMISGPGLGFDPLQNSIALVGRMTPHKAFVELHILHIPGPSNRCFLITVQKPLRVLIPVWKVRSYLCVLVLEVLD